MARPLTSQANVSARAASRTVRLTRPLGRISICYSSSAFRLAAERLLGWALLGVGISASGHRGVLVGSTSPGAMTTERSPSTKRTRLSASCLVGAVRLPAEAVMRMTTHWSARSSVDCAGRSPSALWTHRRRSSGWPFGSSSWGCLVRLRCASAGCLLLRRSLSASSALSSSFVTILSLISSHSPGLSTAKVRKTWRSPQVCSLRSSSRSAWSNIFAMRQIWYYTQYNHYTEYNTMYDTRLVSAR